ncbi:MAG: recombinase family protein [Bacteroidales bacterium]|nr:recombinase family protein [Bacteroidales bacterium]
MDKTAVIYARTSSTGAVINKQNTTLQVADLTSYAAHNNLSIVEVYEEHISGA